MLSGVSATYSQDILQSCLALVAHPVQVPVKKKVPLSQCHSRAALQAPVPARTELELPCGMSSRCQRVWESLTWLSAVQTCSLLAWGIITGTLGT